MSDVSNNLITVVIPVYNHEAYIEECLRSVQKQTYTNIEVLITDDGSDDTSGEIAARFAAQDSRFRVITLTHGGPGRARNACIRQMKGDFLMFVDADNTAHPQMAEMLLKAALSSGADFV